ncbi:hypothetical protein [Nocardioides sp. Soil796]|uniref:hypothetical protein n=1 Tax=Nocardioides sp. Soil796 TaxID=1736412 RepID=UPI00070C63F8|nr:hypothetical protein [Nocardioides sp. Soil796]KRF19658.1 hypothetical protein ASH02_24190 [Nocardioides sp. Soil796]
MAEKKAPAAKAATVGDVVKVPKGQTLMVLPDGTVVTARGSYVLDKPGLYVCGSLRVEASESRED